MTTRLAAALTLACLAAFAAGAWALLGRCGWNEGA